MFAMTKDIGKRFEQETMSWLNHSVNIISFDNVFGRECRQRVIKILYINKEIA